MLLPANKTRREQKKRQRGECQQQPETRGMMAHDTRCVGYPLWCEGNGRDRSKYTYRQTLRYKYNRHVTTYQVQTTWYYIAFRSTCRSDVPRKKGGHLPERCKICRREKHAHCTYQTPNLDRVSTAMKQTDERRINRCTQSTQWTPLPLQRTTPRFTYFRKGTWY